MRIKSLKVFGYGKWIDKKFNVSSDMHVFFGKNEAGKSTLMSFLHSVLFGFPARNSQKLRYEPKESSRYGGQIDFQDIKVGDGRIERVDGKSSGDVTVETENGAEGKEDLLKSLVYGIDKDLYQQLFSFQLKDLEMIAQLKRNDIDRYFVSVGLLGSKEYIRLADNFIQEAGSLYKPSGRVPKINQQLEILNKKNTRLVSAREKNKEYLIMTKKIDDIEKENNGIEKAYQKNAEMLEHLKNMENDWEVKLEIDQLKNELTSYSLPSLPEDGLYQLKAINAQIEEIREKLRKNNQKLQDIKVKYKPSELFLLYKENETVIRNFENKLPYINEKQRELTRLETKKEHLIESITKRLAKEDFDSTVEMPKIWVEEENEKIINWRKKLSTFENEISEINKKLSYNQFQLDAIQNDIDELEKEMWPNEKYQSETEDESDLTPSTNSATSPILLLSLSMIFILSFFIFNGTTQYITLIIGLISLILGGTQLIKNKKTDNIKLADNDQEKQKEYKNTWRNKLAQMDELVHEQTHFEKELNLIEKKIENIKKEFDTFKEMYSLPSSVKLEDILDKKENYIEIHDKQNQLDTVEKNIKSVVNKIETNLTSISFIGKYFPVQETVASKLQTYNHFLSKVKDEEQYLNDYVKETDNIKNQIEQLNIEEKNKAEEKLSLLKSVGTDNEEAYRKLFEQQTEKNKKEDRLNDLEERYQYFASQNKFQNIEEVKSQIVYLENQEKEMKKKEKQNIENKATMKYDLKNLEEGSEYTNLLQDYENEKSSLQELLDEWLIKRISSKLIKDTLQKGTEDQLPIVIEDTIHFFKILTNDNYQNIHITEKGIKVVDHKGTTFFASELSRGTAEPLYVALRFAFIKNISQTIKLPLIIDDGFVNFDDERKTAVYSLLKEMSEYTQVLYFTFDETILEYIEKDQVTMLN